MAQVVVRRKNGEQAKKQKFFDDLNRCCTVVQTPEGNKRWVKGSDIWWTRKTLKAMLSNPIIRSGSKFEDYTPTLRGLLNKLDERWPEVDFPERNGKPVKKYTEPGARLVTKCALRGVQKKLKEIRNQLAYWEPRYAKLPFSDKRWKEVHEKVNGLRGQAVYFQTRIQQLKEKL